MKRIVIAGAAVAAALAGLVLVTRAPAPVPEAARGPAPTARSHAAAAPSLPGAALHDEALSAAASLATPDTVRWLAAQASRDDRTAARAANVLGSIRDRTAASALAEVVVSDAPMIVRANAARALAAAGGPDQAGVLARLVQAADQPVRVRQEAALALAKIGGPVEVPALVAALDSGDEQVRISVEQALGSLGTEPARRALAARAHADLSPTERAFVRHALRD